MKVFINKSILAVALLFLCHISSCKAQQNESFDSYLQSLLESISNDIDEGRLYQFKHAEIDSTGNTINLIQDELDELLSKRYQVDKVYLDSISSIESIRNKMVAICLHHYCNKDVIDFKIIYQEFEMMDIYSHRIRLQSELTELQKIAYQNDQYFKIGDTIKATFIVDSEFGKNRIVYNKAPDSLYYDGYNKTIELLGIVKNKYYIKQNNSSYKELIFDYEIISINGAENVFYSERRLKEGDKIEIYVTSYARLLKKG